MRVRTRISIVGILLSIVAALLSSMLSTGSEVRLAFVLTVFFSGFAGGASVVSIISDIRCRNRGKD